VKGNPDNLRRAATAKRRAAHDRADDGLRRLVKNGRPITFASVAAEAGVSKDFLYRNADLRSRIEQLRGQQDSPAPVSPSAREEQTEISSIVRTLTFKLTQERAEHRRELAELREALAAAHGQLLTLRRRLGLT